MTERASSMIPRTSARRLLGLLTAGALALATSGCSASADSASDSTSDTSLAGTLRVGQLGSSKVYEALLDASGEAEGLPYSIEYSLFPGGGPGFIEASRSGSVDIASMADTPPIFGQASNAPITIVAAKRTVAQDASVVEILVPKDSPARTLTDLRGKKLAMTAGTTLQYTAIRALDEAGMSIEDVQVVDLPPPDAATAFSGGDVDAIATLDPQRSLLLAAGAKKVGDGVGTTAGLGYMVATKDALADDGKRALIEDFLQRIKRAEAWADANTQEWAERYAAVTGLPEPVALSIVEHEQVQYVPIDDEVIAAQQEQADVYTEIGLIPTVLDVREEFDDRYNELLAGAE